MNYEPQAHTNFRHDALAKALQCYRDAAMWNRATHSREHRKAVAEGDRWMRHAQEEILIPDYREFEEPRTPLLSMAVIAVASGLFGLLIGALVL